MKRIKKLSLIALLLCLSAPAMAQVNINVNLGTPVYRQPIYNEVADYYYLPDYGVYYNVNRQVYVYPEQGQWVYARRLPARYGYHHDWRRTHFVRMHERAPFLRNDYYGNKYNRRNKPAPYYQAPRKDHRDQQRYDKHDNRGRGNGNGHGNGRGAGHGHGRH